MRAMRHREEMQDDAYLNWSDHRTMMLQMMVLIKDRIGNSIRIDSKRANGIPALRRCEAAKTNRPRAECNRIASERSLGVG